MCETGWDRWSEERDESEGVKGKAEPQASFLSLSFRVFVFTGAGMVAVPPQPVPVGEKRRKVGAWLLMVSVVPQRSTPKAKGKPDDALPKGSRTHSGPQWDTQMLKSMNAQGR